MEQAVVFRVKDVAIQSALSTATNVVEDVAPRDLQPRNDPARKAAQRARTRARSRVRGRGSGRRDTEGND